MQTIYILNYNNYYNRILKKEATLEDYQSYVIYTLAETNFVPNDGVNTQHDIGSNAQMYDGTGDYLLVINEFNEIVSRWFIIDAVRNRSGQYSLTLRRDLLADFKDEIMSADCFVEKGNVGFDNPLIFNKENMSLNQIKTSETLLKDSTNCPWIVGYIPRNLEEQTGTFTPLITPDYKLDMNLSDWEYADYLTTDFKCYPEENSSIQFVFTQDSQTEQKFINFSIAGDMWSSWRTGAFLNGLFYATTGGVFAPGYPPNDTARAYFPASLIKQYFDVQILNYLGYKTEAQTNELLKYKDKIVQFNDGIYRISFDNKTWRSTSALYFSSETRLAAIYNRLKSWTFSAQESGQTATWYGEKGNGGNLDVTGTAIRLTATKVSNVVEQSYTWKIPGASSRAHLQDAPYDMFCIPYGPITVNNGATSFTTNAENSLSITNDIISNLVTASSGELYDVQLLPYCPLKEDVRVDDTILLSKFVNNTFYSLVTQGTDNIPINAIFFVDSSSFSVNIPYNVTITDAKIESNTDMYRLSSPNYNGQFEFNAAMNNGISYFTAECTYLPFTPYIHVKPDFKGLYGAENFNDARGLICGGDFSLPIVNDAWNQYKLNNKNYQEIFDRQIQNMNTTQNIARIQEGWGIATGALQGGVAGAFTGSKFGGGYGAALGAALGAGASLAGGLADRTFNEQLRTEAIDYTRDNFQYHLGNVQALPNSLTKVSSFNINNRIFPVLEYYTCTQKEKELFANKIAFNGMSIDVIDKLDNYIRNDWSYNEIESRNYVKGRLIYLPHLQEDYHITNAISEEVYKGFFNKEIKSQ